MQYNKEYNYSPNYDSYASDNSTSKYYEEDKDNRIYTVLNYSKNINVGVKEVLNVIEVIGFDRSSFYLSWGYGTRGGQIISCDNFLKKYGKDLLQISEELDNMGIYFKPSLFSNGINLYKKKSGELDAEYRTTFYSSFKEIKDKLPYDAVEFSKEGFALRYFGPILSTQDEYIGHLVTFIKKN